MLELSSDNKRLYEEFSQNPSDDYLKWLDPMLICKFYFLAEEKDYETQYALIDNREWQLCPTKEVFINEADPNNQSTKDLLERLKTDVVVTNVVKLEDGSCYIEIIFADKNTSAFNLNKVSEDTWKVAYMPMQ